MLSLDFVYLIAGLCLSAFFSGSEAVILSLPHDRVKQMMEEGGDRARHFEFLNLHQGRLLTTILVGNNLINSFIAALLTKITYQYFDDDTLAITVGISTVLILLFGEITPKTFARSRSELFAIPTVRTLKFFMYILYPAVVFFDLIIRLVLGKNAHIKGRLTTKDDIEFMVDKAEKEKSIDAKQIDLLQSILEFPNIKVKDIMVPRHKICTIKAESGFDDIFKLIKEQGHTRYPVCRGDLDNTIGFLHAKDLAFISEQEIERFDLTKLLKNPFFVYEHMKIQAVMDHMNRKKVHLALVKNELGVVVGIITLEDIIEEILGEIVDEHDEEILKAGANEENIETGLTFDATKPLREIRDQVGIDFPEDEDYSTLNGFILDKLGNSFPKQGAVIIWENFSFELLKVENQEIKKVRLKVLDSEKYHRENDYSEESG